MKRQNQGAGDSAFISVRAARALGAVGVVYAFLGCCALISFGAGFAHAQAMIDVSDCAKYQLLLVEKREKRDNHNGQAEGDDAAAARRAELEVDIEVLQEAVRLCSDYFHMQADYASRRRRCPHVHR